LGNPYVPTLLVQGETGTGKGLVARLIHESGPRARGPFIDVNCAAIPENLLEAELFGFEAGAFTDAKRAKRGLFEAAVGGTLFLDEIDALPLALQPKLLKALDEKRARRLGAVVERSVDVKCIAATKEELLTYVAAGRFRADLYHRLAVVLLTLPPLREREADVVLLAEHFLQRYALAHRLVPKQLHETARRWLRGYGWPGNIRELSHLMERATLLHPAPVLDAQALQHLCLPPLQTGAQPNGLRRADSPLVSPPALTEIPEGAEESATLGAEPLRLRQALRQTGGNVARTARLLGLSRSALRYRMRRYGIPRPQEAELAIGPGDITTSAPCQGGQKQRGKCGPRVTAEVAALTPAWERKPVVVLALVLTLPEDTGSAAVRYSRWTVMVRWEQQLTETIQGFGGVMMQRFPALSTAAFGLPSALEQMVPRAIQAGLAIQRLVAEARTYRREEPSPTVRLAVHMGAALIDVHASDPTAWLQAMGETLALPVQLLGHAQAGELLVSSQVVPQIENVCVLQARELRLAAEPSPRVVYSVMGLRPWHSAPGDTGERALSRFVGRERQLADVQAQLTQAMAGQGHVVGIVGEAGIGKSRLLHEFRRSLSEEHVTYVEGHCQSYGSTSPYLPVLDLLRQLCGITDRDGPDVMTAKIYAVLQRLGLTPAETAPYLLHLLGLSEGTQALAVLSPEVIRMRTCVALRQVCLQSSRQRLLIITVENLHWVDTTSEAFFVSLVEELAGAPLLFLATYRPGYRPPWLDKSYASQIALRPLSPDESQSLVRSLPLWPQVRAPLRQEILAKAEGNPFFLEELVWAALEQASLTVPATIQGVLMARLDRLPEASKKLVQTTAVLGRTVPHSLLALLWDGPGELTAHLRELQRLEFLYTQADADDPVYCFKHVLTQEVAYESLPVPSRQALHAAAGRTLEARYADRLEEIAERLAYHYARSGEAAKAVTYLALCAARAARSYAHADAVTILQEALHHVEYLPATDRERRGLELALRQALSLSMLGRFRDILDLLLPHQANVKSLGDPALAGPYYFRLGFTYFYMGNRELAAQYVQHALTAAQRCTDVVTLGQSYYLLALQENRAGHFLQGVEHGRQAVALLEGTQEWHWLGLAQWVLSRNYVDIGAFDAARAAAAQAAAIGTASGDPRLQSFAALSSGVISSTRGDWQEGVAACQRGLACAPDPVNAALARGWLGYAYVEHGDPARAIPLLEQALQQYRRFRLYVMIGGQFTTFLSEAYRVQGSYEQARALALEGLALEREVQRLEGVAWAQRVLGRIAQAQGALVEAEQLFQEALQAFASSQAQFEVGRTYLDLAATAQARQDRDTVTTCLRKAHQLFRTLQVPKYVEHTVQMAAAYGVQLT
jgi:DNA-binding NtrC family response regulator/tetratricopeptide (TPR) repeat protein